MKKWLLVAMTSLTEYDKVKLEEQIKEPCYDWDLTMCQQLEICFSPLFFQGKKQLMEYLTVTEKGKEDVIVLSDDSQCLGFVQKLGFATLGYQSKDVEGFLEGTDLVMESLEDIQAELLYRQIQRANEKPWTILETERLVVREFQMSDLDDLFLLYQGEGMTDYIESLYPYEEEKEYQQAYINHMYRYFGYGMWLVFEKKSGRLVGRAGIEHREEFKGELELGYAIGTPYQRKGFATEVCLAICEYSKNYLDAKQLFCMVEPENKASIALAEKIGFTFEEECVNDGKRMCIMRCIL